MEIREGLAYLTAGEMKEADEEAIGGYEIDVLALMENAGSAVAGIARELMGGTVAGRKIVVLAGKGNNGGDGLVAARHLHDWGADVSVLLSEEGGLGPVPVRQLVGVRKAGVPVSDAGGSIEAADLLIDSLLGYNSKGDPREPVKGMILSANAAGTRTLAVDIPSGLDATTGESNDPCIVAESTVTLGFPKTGFLNPQCRKQVGGLYLADVSLPRELYTRLGQDFNPFAMSPVFRIW